MQNAARLALGYAALALAWMGLRALLFGGRADVSAVALSIDAAFFAASALGLYLALRARDTARHSIEERLSVTTDTYADWYWMIDAQLRFTTIQGAGLARFGINPAEVLGKPSSEIGFFELVDLTREDYARLRAERKAYRDVRASMRMADGTLRYMSINGEPVFSADGTFTGYRGITREITAQFETELALRASEHRFRNMVEVVPHLTFFITNPARDRWDYVSPNVNAIWNYSGPLTGIARLQVLADRIVPEDRARLEQRVEAESRGEMVSVGFRINDPDGGLRWMRTCTIGVPGEHGEVEVYGVTEDITERHQILERISASEAQQRSVLESMAEGMIIRDLQGLIISTNRAAERILGLSEAQMLGNQSINPYGPALRDDGSLFAPEDRPWIVVTRTGTPVLGAVLGALKPDGSRVWVRINAVPLRATDGALSGVVSTLQDITVERAALAELARSAATLERRVNERTAALVKTNRELEAFAHSVSHDLRTPLRAINGFARLLADREGPRFDAESRRLLSRIEAGAGRMGELIDDVIEYSRVTRREPEFSAVDLDRLAASVVTRVAGEFPAARLEIELMGRIYADEKMVEHVLEALIGNALKFSASGATPQVRVWAEASGDMKTVHVTDNGAGFDMAHTGHLFTLFRRLHHDHEFPGTGVGLATVKNLVERQGGTVAAQGEVGHGATFSFSLGTTARESPLS